MHHEDEERATRVLSTDNPFKAKEIADEISASQEWLQVRESEMEKVARAKYSQCKEARDYLIDTKDKRLVEDTSDEFWARGKNGKGRNVMGHILESVRSNPPQENFIYGSKERKTDQSEVLLLTNSLGKDINPDVLVKNSVVNKTMTYKIDDAYHYMETYNGSAEKVILQVITNDVNESEENPEEVFNKLSNLTDFICTKLPRSQIYVSQCLPKGQNEDVNRNINKINALLYNIDGIKIIAHDNFKQNNQDLFQSDRIHLTRKGTSFLASNIRKVIEPFRDRSRSRDRSQNGDRYYATQRRNYTGGRWNSRFPRSRGNYNNYRFNGRRGNLY